METDGRCGVCVDFGYCTGARVILSASIVAVFCMAGRGKRQATLEAAMGQARRRRVVAFGSLGALALLADPPAALAGAGGVRFWFPGTVGRPAAGPGVPCGACPTISLHE